MAKNSAIEWTDHTFNPWHGCIEVSPACTNCYARTFDKRIGGHHWGPASTTPRRFFGEKHWVEPTKWNAAAEKEGVRKRVFCASMADVFESESEIHQVYDDLGVTMNTERRRLWKLIEATPWLDWLLLTKRPENILPMTPHQWHQYSFGEPRVLTWPQNVWVGTTVENQEYADKRIPELLKVPAAVRFLSMEPLLGPVDLSQWICADGMACKKSPWLLHHYCPDNRLSWVITGGESGPHARPGHPDWYRSLRDQCQAAGVPFHFKQWGEWWPSGPRIVENARMIDFGGEVMYRVGKHKAGRELDGRTHDEFPQSAMVVAS